MNKQEKIIAALLGLALVGWLWYSTNEQKKAAEVAEYAETLLEIQGLADDDYVDTGYCYL